MMPNSRSMAFLMVVALWVMYLTGAHQDTRALAQVGEQIATDAGDARPLATVVRELAHRLKSVVTYEDPPWDYAADFHDVTAEVRRDGDMSKKVFSPRGGRFEFIPPAAAVGPDAALRTLVNAYNRSGLDGEFDLLRTDEVYHVVPISAKDQLGSIRPYRSLLSRRVTVRAGPRPILEATSELVDSLNKQQGRKIGLATAPTNLLMRMSVEGGANNEDARTVLLRLIAASGRQLSWTLLCQPGAEKLCYLNLQLVQ
jgi:hypothetical protein